MTAAQLEQASVFMERMLRLQARLQAAQKLVENENLVVYVAFKDRRYEDGRLATWGYEEVPAQMLVAFYRQWLEVETSKLAKALQELGVEA